MRDPYYYLHLIRIGAMNLFSGQARFICSAGRFEELPPPSGDEFALVGRSNVGKSSFINHVCADRALARTSKRPGTTVCANLYHIDDSTVWVDLPGYGYARTGPQERDRWARLSRDYCERRSNLRGIIWLLDIRHIGTEIDGEAYRWLKSLEKAVLPVLAKADKLPRSGQKRQTEAYLRGFGDFKEPVLYTVHEHASRERFWDRFAMWRGTIP